MVLDVENEILDIQEDTTIGRIGIPLDPKVKKEIANWDKFQLVNSKMELYQSVTKSEALLNAIELSQLIKDVSDTIDIAILDRPDLKMRFNVLYNYAYRLYDMSTINSITDEEVIKEITG